MNTVEKFQGYLYSFAVKMIQDEKMIFNGEPISSAGSRILFHHAKTAEENQEEHYYFFEGDYKDSRQVHCRIGARKFVAVNLMKTSPGAIIWWKSL